MHCKRLLPSAASLLALVALASSTLPLTMDEHFAQSAAVCHGVVRRVESFVDPGDGVIRTRALVEVRESFKGAFPPVVQLVHRGGAVDGVGLVDGFAPNLRVGEERLFFLQRAEDRTLFALAGGISAPRLQRAAGFTVGGKAAPFIAPHEALLAQLRALSSATLAPGEDVSDQTGLLTVAEFSGGGGSTSSIGPAGQNTDNDNGFPSRFLPQDRGEPIGYLVDAQFLPPGISLAQGTNAVASAFAAWAAVTGIRFEFQGLVNFGNAASASTNLDGGEREDSRIRVQLHDAFGASPGGSVLGVGGRFSSFFTEGDVPLNWGVAGNVKGFEFNRSVAGFVVLEHTNTALSNPLTLAEVLCHEVGHVLNLAHSSETPNEPDTVLSNAVMYFRVHADGRGATLGSYDRPVVQASYPPTNPPPWTHDRVMDVVVSLPAQPNVPGVNSIRLQAFDLLDPGTGANVFAIVQNASDNFGTFSVSGLDITYEPDMSLYGTGPRLDPAEGEFYEIAFARVSDGTNASPWVRVRVISVSVDDFPSPSDGIPNNWMVTYFGGPDPDAGPQRGANEDFDGDGFTNFEEYLLGSDPTRSDSNFRILSLLASSLTFQSRPYENYELLASTNLTNWARLPISVLPLGTNATFTNLFATNAVKTFYRVGRVP